jgi:hypothetical protein
MIALFMLSATGANAQSKLRYTDCAGNSTAIEAMDEAQRDNLSNVANGTKIFNTTTQKVEIWNSNSWVGVDDPPEEPIKEEILFKIYTEDGTYTIPTFGLVGGEYHSYDWNVFVDGVKYTATPTTSPISNTNGIELTVTPGTRQIRITPVNDPAPGWGNAFGHNNSWSGANSDDNKKKLISIDAPLTTMAFAPEVSEDVTVTNASQMFANMFHGCRNLTAGAKIADTYKLPPTVTDLSYFLSGTHFGNTSLISPIDLSGLEGWLDGNTTITNLSEFLNWTHYNNTSLTSPISLIPLKDWFGTDRLMTDLSWFLYGTHSNNTSLDLKGQAIFPDWINTLKEGSTDIENVSPAFYRIFLCIDEKNDDTGEPKFEDGDPLSSLGNPSGSNSKQTYKGRKVFTDNSSIGSNWK